MTKVEAPNYFELWLDGSINVIEALNSIRLIETETTRLLQNTNFTQVTQVKKRYEKVLVEMASQRDGILSFHLPSYCNEIGRMMAQDSEGEAA